MLVHLYFLINDEAVGPTKHVKSEVVLNKNHKRKVVTLQLSHSS